MATSAGADDARAKTVTGYPAPAGQYAAGYPAAPPPYPYMAQPPPPHNDAYRPMAPTPPYYNPQPIRPNGPARPTLLCRLIIAAVAVFTIMSLVSFFTWVALRPELPLFRIDAATVLPLNATAGKLTGTWNITVFAANPNHKLAIYYDDPQASLFYGADDLLATTPLPPFVLVKGNQTRVEFTIETAATYVGNDVAKEISDGKDQGSVRFRVLVEATVRFKSGVFQSRPRSLQVYCNRVDFGFGSNKNGTGTLTGGSSPCEVDL